VLFSGQDKESAAQQPRAIDGKFAVTTSNDVSTAERTKKRTNVTDAKKAKAAGVSESTAAWAKALVEKRPDLADKVQAGEITLNEALRLMKKGEMIQKLGELPDGIFRVLYADPPWKYGNSGFEEEAQSRSMGKGETLPTLLHLLA
jgi:hypothetical protein